MRYGAIVLCGGQSSRMGRPKAWLPLGGEPMLARVVRRAREAVERVVVVAAPGQDVPALPPDVEIVRDGREGEGPLRGLEAGLQALRGRAEAAFLSGCDAPFLSAAFVRHVLDALEPPHLAAAPRVAGRHHPLAAAYALDALPFVAAQLAAGRLRMTDLLGLLPTRFLDDGDLSAVPDFSDCLRNVNMAADYERAAAEILECPPPLDPRPDP